MFKPLKLNMWTQSYAFSSLLLLLLLLLSPSPLSSLLLLISPLSFSSSPTSSSILLLPLPPPSPSQMLMGEGSQGEDELSREDSLPAVGSLPLDKTQNNESSSQIPLAGKLASTIKKKTQK